MSAAFALWLAADGLTVCNALRLDADAMAALARRRLAAALRTANRTDFYRARFDDARIDLADPALDRDLASVLACLPLASKQELRAAGETALVGGRIDPAWHSSRSSGSTGEPFRVYYDPRSWATLKYLVKLRARFECGLQLTDRVASLEALSLEELGNGRVFPGQRMVRLNVLRPAAEVADAMVKFVPDTITGLPSALFEAGRVLETRGQRLPVRAIFTGGELLSRSLRASLEHLYETRVFDVYGTSETKEIAWECRLGGMHVNADVVHVEIAGADGRPVPPGTEGEIIATLLVNDAMPLIRYRTGDWGSLLASQCACGRATPLLGIGTGREADTLVFAGGHRVSSYALTCTLEQVQGLSRYQVVQLGPTQLVVRAIVGGAADRPTIANQLRATLLAGVAPNLEVQVEFVEELPTGPQAKFRVVQRMETS